MRFLEDGLHAAPKLCAVDIMGFRIGRHLVGLFGGIHQTARCERAPLAPTITIVINARDEIPASGKFS